MASIAAHSPGAARQARATARVGGAAGAGISAARTRASSVPSAEGGVPGEHPRRRVDADEVAAPRQQVEPRLEELILGPAVLERACGARLPQLLEPRPLPAATEFARQQPRDLHRDRARAARGPPAQPVAERAADGAPVDAAVVAEAPVLLHHRDGDQRRGDAVERHPVEAAEARIGADDVENAAVAREEAGLAGGPARAGLGVARKGRGGGEEEGGERGEGGGEEPERAPPPPRPSFTAG